MEALEPLGNALKQQLVAIANELLEIVAALQMIGQAAVAELAQEVEACAEKIQDIVTLPRPEPAGPVDPPPPSAG